jgi:glycosyltransferase involved in cell wall biosynthesis
MRILIVTHRYPPFGLTGVERVAEQTALSLAAAGDEVTVLTRRETAAPPFPILEHTERNGVAVRMISGGGHMHGRFPKLTAVMERLFERTLMDVDPDVVLVSHLADHSPGYVSIARRWNVPVIVELHDYYTVCEQARLQRVSGELCQGPEGGRACAVHCFGGQAKTLERWALRTHMFRDAVTHADALVTPSRFVADYFAATFGDDLPPMHVIGNGVDARHHGPSPRTPDGTLNIGYVGAVVEHKGIHVLVEALRLAALRRVRLTLFGVTVRPYFGELLEAAEMVDNLELRAYGPFDPAELPFLLDDVDLIVIPSVWWETYSIVMREAFACGIPVIASRLGALPEGIRDGDNGLLFTAGSAVELATILQSLDADRARLGALREGIRADDWISVRERANQLRGVIDGVRAGRRPGPAPDPGLAELGILRDALADDVPVS